MTRKPVGVAGALGLLLLPLLLWVGGGASAQEGPRPALSDLAGCVRSEGSLAVEIVVDESGSLRDTDPQDSRVAAVNAAVRNLAGLAGVGTSVRVQLSTFSVDHRVLVPFVKLDRGSVARLTQAAQALAELDRGIDTDFAAALTAARRGLAAQQEKCRTLLLFTDGNYDLQPGASRAAKSYAPEVRPVDRASADRLEAVGRELLCRPQGTVDQLRVDATKVLVVPLTTGISAADQGFLRAMANGTGPAGANCGVRGTAATGAYIPASEFGQLLDVFDDLTSQRAGGTTLPDGPPVKVCPRAACPSGQRSFTIDPGIRRFHVLVDLGVSGLEVEIAPPNGQRPTALRFDNGGQSTVGGVAISHFWLSPSALSADVTIPPKGGLGVGRWTVTVIDRTGGKAGSLADFQVHVYGDLGAALLSEPEVVIGETTPLEIGLVDGEGSPLTPGGLVKAVQITAAVTDPASGRTTELGRVEPDAEGKAQIQYAVPRDLAAGSVTLTLTTSVTTPSGLVLRPTSGRTPLTVRPPADFPTVSPAALDLDVITATRARAAELVVTGGTKAAGCIWVEGIETGALPPDAERLVTSIQPQADSRETCLRVAAGEKRTLTVRVGPARSASGPVQATVELRLVSENSPEQLKQSVPLAAELVLPVDEPRRLALFLALLAVGLLVPFLLLHIANMLSARFAGAEYLRSARIPVQVVNNEISRRQGPPRLLTVSAEEFRNVPVQDTRPTTIDSSGLAFRRVLPKLPVRIPYAEVEAGGRAVTSSGGHRWRRGSCAGRLTLQLAGDWVFVLDRVEEDGMLLGDLHLFVGDSVNGARPDEVVDRCIQGLPHVRRLAAEAVERIPVPTPESAPPSNDWAGAAEGVRAFGDLPPPAFGAQAPQAAPDGGLPPPARPSPPTSRPNDDLPPPITF